MKHKVIIAAVAAMLLVTAIGLYQNRHGIALKMNTDSEMMAIFESISVGDTVDEVIVKMGEPIGISRIDAEQTQYEKDTQYLKWPRYKGTTFALRVVDGVVVEKYPRWGS